MLRNYSTGQSAFEDQNYPEKTQSDPELCDRSNIHMNLGLKSLNNTIKSSENPKFRVGSELCLNCFSVFQGTKERIRFYDVPWQRSWRKSAHRPRQKCLGLKILNNSLSLHPVKAKPHATFQPFTQAADKVAPLWAEPQLTSTRPGGRDNATAQTFIPSSELFSSRPCARASADLHIHRTAEGTANDDITHSSFMMGSISSRTSVSQSFHCNPKPAAPTRPNAEMLT